MGNAKRFNLPIYLKIEIMRKLLLATIAGLATLFISAQNAETVQNSEQLKHANAAGKDGGKYPDYSMDILRESETNSKVMNYAFNLTDVSGPRLTASPGFTKAANWAREIMCAYQRKDHCRQQQRLARW